MGERRSRDQKKRLCEESIPTTSQHLRSKTCQALNRSRSRGAKGTRRCSLNLRAQVLFFDSPEDASGPIPGSCIRKFVSREIMGPLQKQVHEKTYP